jgi:putative transcriptional regulator
LPRPHHHLGYADLLWNHALSQIVRDVAEDEATPVFRMLLCVKLLMTGRGQCKWFGSGYPMTKKIRAKSEILQAVHETAADFYKLGLIDKHKMKKFDALCLEPLPDYDPQKIRFIRESNNISQATLAVLLNISLSTVRKWESGEIHPSGPSLKLLHLIDRKGLEAVI